MSSLLGSLWDSSCKNRKGDWLSVRCVSALGTEVGRCKEVTLLSSSPFADCVQTSLIRATEITSPSGCVFFTMKWTGNWGNRNLTALVWTSAGEMVGKTVVVINPQRLLWKSYRPTRSGVQSLQGDVWVKTCVCVCVGVTDWLVEIKVNQF